MSIFDSSYCGSIWHHGIKGQRWGVRRTPDQLGHDSREAFKVEKSYERAKIVDGIYHSPKGFVAAVAKLARYCLNPEKPHAKEFFDVGYKQSDSDLLFRHIEEGFDVDRKTGMRKNDKGQEQFRISMNLGVTRKKAFTTSWQIDQEGDRPKLTSAYRDHRSEGE